MELDRIDFELLRLLQDDARLSNKQLAARVGLAQSTCHERVRRLWSQGAITAARVEVDARRLGFAIEALFLVGISRHEEPIVAALMDEWLAVDEVQSVYLITGRYDLVVKVIARDMDHLRELAYRHFTHLDTVSRFETSIVYEGRERPSIPHIPVAD
jgi:DNA-binding Lrp family transcriptional regulator